MMNYPIDPAILQPRLPRGCELDFFDGRTFVSMVGFRFLDTRVMGCRLPGHTDFDEINLRFYVRHRNAAGEWQRGVVFVREIVPRRLIAFVARTVYNEPYIALPCRHDVQLAEGNTPGYAEYAWQFAGRWNRLRATFAGEPAIPPMDAEETFITEHYWGYNAQRNGGTKEYQVEHPRWPVWNATTTELDCDIAALYGAEYVPVLTQTPSSAFIAVGSEICVRQGTTLKV